MEKSAEALFLENQLCFPLYAASRLTTKLYGDLLNELDLTYPQYLVMLVLWQHGECTVTQLGRLLLLESNTLTPLLKRLEQKGYLIRTRQKSDERSVLVALSAKGKELKSDAIEIPYKLLENFKDESLSKDELKAFQKTLFKLLNVLKKNSL